MTVLGNIQSALSSILVTFEILGKLWNFGKRITRGFANEGIYKVENFMSVIELFDTKGRRSRFKKIIEIRYLQDNVNTFTDIGWADGEGFLDYRVRPGIPVDEFKVGHRKYKLISLRENKHKGDSSTFNIQWDIKNGFLKPDGYWQTDILHRFDKAQISAVFPKSRPPKRVLVEEANQKRTRELGPKSIRQLSDGRWKVSWKIDKPKIYEQYILRWDW